MRGFCEQRQLRESSFYWWRREFAIRDGKPLLTKRWADSTRIARHMGAHPQEATFVRLRVKPTPGLRSFRKWLDAPIEAKTGILPKGAMGEAVTYARRNSRVLSRYTMRG